jgi:hypothetical protein
LQSFYKAQLETSHSPARVNRFRAGHGLMPQNNKKCASPTTVAVSREKQNARVRSRFSWSRKCAVIIKETCVSPSITTPPPARVRCEVMIRAAQQKHTKCVGEAHPSRAAPALGLSAAFLRSRPLKPNLFEVRLPRIFSKQLSGLSPVEPRHKAI